MIDFDKFNDVNTRYGHQGGDVILRQASGGMGRVDHLLGRVPCRHRRRLRREQRRYEQDHEEEAAAHGQVRVIDESRLAALREFGYVPAIRHEMRQVWYSRWIDATATLGQDLTVARIIDAALTRHGLVMDFKTRGCRLQEDRRRRRA